MHIELYLYRLDSLSKLLSFCKTFFVKLILQLLTENIDISSHCQYTEIKRENRTEHQNDRIAVMKKQNQKITYHNKDVLSKILAENFRDKSLKVYGLDVPRIKQILPTNLPAIQVNELRLDNLFLLEDDSIAIIDYESSVKRENYLKYLNYVVRVLERYKKDKIPKKLRMIVIYTADVEYTEDTFSAGCLTLKLEQAYLSKIDSKRIHDNIQTKLQAGISLTDEELMELIVLPLTYKGDEKKKLAALNAVNLAKQIPNKDTQTFVLSGILTFADKIIDSGTAKHIMEVLRMNQVAKLFIEEGRKEGEIKGKILAYLDCGLAASEIARKLNVDVETINQIISEDLALV